MADKQLVNSAGGCVAECLYGFGQLHPRLGVDSRRGVVFDPSVDDDRRVAVISGGGSGHEPFPTGYVGEGMLRASVSGDVFTCPPSKNVLHAIRLVSGRSSGVLLLVGNYTGDVLNFGLAAEDAASEGVRVDSVVVGDDVGGEMGGSRRKAGKRGMCGLVLAIKVAGYFADSRKDLKEVKKWSSEVAGGTASMGLCVSACSKPGVGPLFHLGRQEMEVGVGVHGEAGGGRSNMLSARGAVETLLKFILGSLEATEGDQVVAVLNNLGSLSVLEQWLLAGELESQLSDRKIQVVRLYAGRFFTSLNMAGVQISILKLNPDTRDTILAALDHPTTASAWPATLPCPVLRPCNLLAPPLSPRPHADPKGPRLDPRRAQLLADSFARISHRLSMEEDHLNQLDSVCGDGDCGTTFGRMAAIFSGREWDFSLPQPLFSGLCSEMQESVGGTTGALYGLFLRGISQALGEHDEANGLVISRCWRAGLESVKKYTTARRGDRTMLDALEPGCDAFESHLQDPANPTEAFTKAVTAAMEGCRRTKDMKALAGRASYTDPVHQKDVDAGAYAVTVWLSGIQEALEERQ